MDLRKDTKILYLEEYPLEQLLGAKFPKKSEVFRHYLYHVTVLGKPMKEAAFDTALSVSKFWNEAVVETKDIRCCKEDILKIANAYKVLMLPYAY